MKHKDLKLPIAETFVSIQGEGSFVGTPMFFIRIAGCTVGSHAMPGMKSPEEEERLYNVRRRFPAHTFCRSLDGQVFLCDTDYRMKTWHTIETLYGLIDKVGVEHVCITGGEPLARPDELKALLDMLSTCGWFAHLETSGTHRFPEWLVDDGTATWVTCSPKHGYQMCNTSRVNEFKFLVGAGTDIKHYEEIAEQVAAVEKAGISPSCLFYVQPINPVIGHSDVNLALDVLAKHPDWRLSVQLHKLFNLQ